LKTVVKNTTVADKLLFLFMITASLAGIFISRAALPQGREVVVEINGEKAYSFALDQDRTFSVTGPYGDTVIEIRNKKARVKEAHCPNRLCEKQGWISKGVIVCMPNRIVVSVGSGAANSLKEVDAITG
jgi:hypothetical protein